MTDSNAFKTYDAPLGADETFTGLWMSMSNFSAFCAVVTGDQLIASARFEWSDDGETVRFVQPWIVNDNPISYGGAMSATTPTQASRVRLVVVNGGNAQGESWLVQTSLLIASPSGYVSPLADFPEDSDPGQTVKAIMYGRRVGSVDPQYTQVLLDDGGSVIVSGGILPTTAFGQRIPATLDSTLVTSFAPELRNSLSIFNSSTAGNLYIRLANDVDISFDDWDYMIVPGGFWVAPPWGGDVYVAWDDDSDGYAHCQEVSG